MKQTGRSSLGVAIWTTVGIVLAIALIIVVKVTSGSTSAPVASGVASAELMSKITKLDTGVYNTVGKGTSTKSPSAIADGEAYTIDNKPAILYVGAEYCPYCATERWPMVIALSRFGTFKNLGTTSSSATDSYPSTATLSFHGATYTSQYLSFTGVEETTNTPKSDGSGYTILDTPTAAQQALITKYDAAPYVSAAQAGSIPFVYLGGKYLMIGTGYDPSILQGKTQDQIATALADPTSSISKGAVGTANILTATMCKLTNDQPANVCNTSAITALKSSIQ